MIGRRILLFAVLTAFLGETARGQVHGPPPGFNYSEADVPAYELVDPLRFGNGEPVTNRLQWAARRAEILRSFEDTVFGRMPLAARQLPLHYKVLEHEAPALDGLALRSQVLIALTSQGLEGPVMHLLLYLPAQRSSASPVILGLNFGGNPSVANDPGILATPVWPFGSDLDAVNSRGEVPRLEVFSEENRGRAAPEWQPEMLLRRGYGLATVYYGDIDIDSPNAPNLSIRAHYRAGSEPATSDSWGSLSAWAWGLDLAFKYLLTDHHVDQKEVVVMGHSRLGKAAAWAAAQDSRFAGVLSNESGKGGASLFHRQFGETIAHLEQYFPYWFCPNFAQWTGRDRDIPVDGNLLLALIAPRPLYVASAEHDFFSDPRGEFLSAQNVGQVYGLLGKQGLGVTDMPEVDEPVMHDVGYHMRSGNHRVTQFDWEQYLAFLDLRFGSPLTRAKVPSQAKAGTR